MQVNQFPFRSSFNSCRSQKHVLLKVLSSQLSFSFASLSLDCEDKRSSAPTKRILLVTEIHRHTVVLPFLTNSLFCFMLFLAKIVNSWFVIYSQTLLSSCWYVYQRLTVIVSDVFPEQKTSSFARTSGVWCNVLFYRINELKHSLVTTTLPGT